MDPLAPRVARRFLAGQGDEPRSIADGVIYDSDTLTPEAKPHWKGYELVLNHATYSPEEWDDGDTANRKQEAKTFTSLEALVKHLAPFKFAEWVDRSRGLLGGKPKKDRKGGVTQTDASVGRKDGQALNHEEHEFLSDRLKVH